jgi:organic radical activating enzyme
MKPEKNNTYCKYPFRELAMKEWQGSTLQAAWPCCMMGNIRNQDGSVNNIGINNIKDLTPDEIFNHPRINDLRNNLLTGVKDDACKVCWDQESRGLNSFRLFSDDDYGYEDTGLSVVDITASTACNLRCRMCTPMSSNSLMIDWDFFEKMEGEMNFQISQETKFWAHIKPEPIRATDSIQWNWLMENTDKIKVIKASGGEPFYDKKVVKLIDRYIETGNAKNTILTFHTNGTLINDEIIEKLNHFKKNVHNFSIDGFGKTYDYIRYPANFEELDLTLRNYFSKIKSVDFFRVALVLTSLNLLVIPEYIKWIRSIWNKSSITFSEAYGLDRGTSIKRLPISILSVAKENVLPFLYNERGDVDHKIQNLIQQIDNAISDNQENKELMLKEIGYFDLSRNQNFKDYLHPLLVDWLTS